MGRRSPGNATLRLVAFISIAVFVITLYLFTSKPELLGRVGKNINEASASWRHSGNDRITRPDESPIRKALVAASVKGNDVSWMHDFFPDWQPNIYVMNDPTANLTVKENKGNEAAAYLTYIIDNYDNLPDVMVFIHALRYQWHNEDPMYDHVPVLRNLSLAHVFENGYVSLRCTWDVGCPAEMYPVGDDAPDFDPHWPFVNMRKAYGKGFKALFPDTPLPERVGAPCCSQFAVTKASVRMRSLEDYERYRRWLWETDMESMISGRIMEYVWHSMFSAIPPQLQALANNPQS